MKLADVEQYIKTGGGYRVRFEWIKDGILEGDHFPDREEDPFQAEDIAWKYARDWAAAMKSDKVCNVYVIHASDHTPVGDYQGRELLPRR